jgi:cytochrome c-type biogenesis protein CcmH
MSRPLLIAGTIALLVAASAPASAVAESASLPDVEDEVMCTICGTLLAESDSPQADRERALIRELIAQGKDKDEIKDALVAEYGPRVLATPTGHGFDLLAWLVPGAGIGLVLGALVWFALRRRRPPQTPKSIEPADAALLDRDMSRYDL